MQAGCERVVPILHRYVEGELDSIRGSMVERHLAVCPSCLQEKEQLDLERLWLVESALKGPALSARLVDKIMEPVRREAKARSRARWWRRTLAATAAACLLAVLLGYGYSNRGSFGVVDPRGSLAESDASVSTSPVPEGSVRAAPAELEAPDRTAVRVAAGNSLLNPAESRRLAASGSSGDRAVRLPLADLQAVERGGLRSGRTNATFVNFGLPDIACLPQASRDELSDVHDRTSCEIGYPTETAEAGGTRVVRVQLSSFTVRSVFRVRFRDTLGIALRLRSIGDEDTEEGSGHRAGPHAVPLDLDPCVPDPNSDGRTDSGDVAYGLQVLYGAQPPDGFDAEPVALDPECEGSCLRA